MHIRLMTHIKNQAVLLGIKNGFQSNGKLHNSQISGKMSAGFGNILDEKFPNFSA